MSDQSMWDQIKRQEDLMAPRTKQVKTKRTRICGNQSSHVIKFFDKTETIPVCKIHVAGAVELLRNLKQSHTIEMDPTKICQVEISKGMNSLRLKRKEERQ